MSLCTCSRAVTSPSGSGVGVPASIISVPTIWATTSCTVQPGSEVGVCQSSSDRPASKASMASQEANKSGQDLFFVEDGAGRWASAIHPMLVPRNDPGINAMFPRRCW